MLAWERAITSYAVAFFTHFNVTVLGFVLAWGY